MAASVSPPLSLSTLATSVESQDEPTIRFTTAKELFQTIDRVSGDCLVATDVLPADFDRIDHQREEAGRKFRFHYRAAEGILIITIPTQIHEVLFRGICESFISQLFQRGIYNRWVTTGAATYRNQDYPGGDGGEGDYAGCPRPERTSIESWPTLVIESGHSQSLNLLRSKKNWWFSASDHQVKIVLLVKFTERGQPRILIEKWEEEPQQARPGATTTRHAAVLRPTLQQSITITRNTATNPVSYHVARGALVLSFRQLFLRNPGPQEGGDIIISISELEELAERTWLFVRE
ncbi:hypothetical protein F4779DRAFT_155823 [Xylariaceae sp. FL0662B]|nr:hypothetical protein F4779DRAFT_155823 [Xylariaceae sp. FL0662B]